MGVEFLGTKFGKVECLNLDLMYNLKSIQGQESFVALGSNDG